jgi:hypothetical protein
MPMLQEGTDCWRPVRATQIDNDVFRVTDEPSEDESWAFAPGSRVRCRDRVFANGQPGLVAFAYAIESDPNYLLLKSHEKEIFRVVFIEGEEAVVKVLHVDEQNEDFVYDPLSTSSDRGCSRMRSESAYVARFADLVSARLEK